MCWSTDACLLLSRVFYVVTACTRLRILRFNDAGMYWVNISPLLIVNGLTASITLAIWTLF